MTYVWPRNRTEIVTLNGFYDPGDSEAFTKAVWKVINTGTSATSEIIAAPALSGKYAVHLKQPIRTCAYNPSTCRHDGLGYHTGRGPSPKGFLFTQYQDLYWKNAMALRLRIVEDKFDNTSTWGILNHSATIMIDASHFGTGASQVGHCVSFNVAAGKAGLSRGYRQVTNGYIMTKRDLNVVAWSGAYDTYYDIYIEWSYDWFNDPDNIYITVKEGTTTLINNYAVPVGHWRNSNNYGGGLPLCAYPIGRIQLQCTSHSSDGSNPPASGFVEAYFTDIMLNDMLSDTLGKDFYDWTIKRSILMKGGENSFSGVFIAGDKESHMFSKGGDISRWIRESISDDWIQKFRGIIREVNIQPKRKRFVEVSAEGYESNFYQERVTLSLSSKTAAEIIEEAVNYPYDKTDFDVTNFFDTVTATYDRIYTEYPTLSILEEMAALEGKMMFINNALAWVFQDPRANEGKGILLKWGSSRIYSYEKKAVDVRVPNKIRVYGSGVMSEREIPQGALGSQSVVIRKVIRPDLTTQTQVNNMADYYVARYLEQLEILIIELRAQITLNFANNIGITIPDLNIHNASYFVISYEENKKKRCTLNLLELTPATEMLLADLSQRSTDAESQGVATDTEAATDIIRYEGIATMRVACYYEVEYNSVVQRSGEVILTNDLIDDLVQIYAVRTDTDYNDPPAYTAYGTDDTEPTFQDTDLGAQSGSRVSVATTHVTTYYAGTAVQKTKQEASFVSGVTNLKEVGIFDLSTGGSLKGRAACAAYTETGGTVTIRFIWRFFPEESGACHFTCTATKDLAKWIETGNALDYRLPGGSNVRIFQLQSRGVNGWWKPTLLSESPPSIHDTTGGYEPGNQNDYYGTQLSLTKYNERGMLKVRMAGTFATPVGGTYLFTCLSVMIGRSGAWNVQFQPFILVFSEIAQHNLTYYIGYEKDYVIWLRFRRGEIDWK